MVRLGLLAIALLASLSFAGLAKPHSPSQRPPDQAATGVPLDPSAVGYLNLHKRHPDAEDGPVEFNSAYTAAVALRRLAQMNGFLTSFADLTNRVRRILTRGDLDAVGNTGEEMQTIGFHNIPLVIEGTILKQDYRLKQAEYELAQLKHARNEVGDQDVDRARRAYAEATRRFQVFWDTKLPTD